MALFLRGYIQLREYSDPYRTIPDRSHQQPGTVLHQLPRLQLRHLCTTENRTLSPAHVYLLPQFALHHTLSQHQLSRCPISVSQLLRHHLQRRETPTTSPSNFQPWTRHDSRQDQRHNNTDRPGKLQAIVKLSVQLHSYQERSQPRNSPERCLDNKCKWNGDLIVWTVALRKLHLVRQQINNEHPECPLIQFQLHRIQGPANADSPQHLSVRLGYARNGQIHQPWGQL